MAQSPAAAYAHGMHDTRDAAGENTNRHQSPEEITMNGWLDDDGPYLTLPESLDEAERDD